MLDFDNVGYKVSKHDGYTDVHCQMLLTEVEHLPECAIQFYCGDLITDAKLRLRRDMWSRTYGELRDNVYRLLQFAERHATKNLALDHEFQQLRSTMLALLEDRPGLASLEQLELDRQ